MLMTIFLSLIFPCMFWNFGLHVHFWRNCFFFFLVIFLSSFVFNYLCHETLRFPPLDIWASYWKPHVMMQFRISAPCDTEIMAYLISDRASSSGSLLTMTMSVSSQGPIPRPITFLSPSRGRYSCCFLSLFIRKRRLSAFKAVNKSSTPHFTWSNFSFLCFPDWCCLCLFLGPRAKQAHSAHSLAFPFPLWFWDILTLFFWLTHIFLDFSYLSLLLLETEGEIKVGTHCPSLTRTSGIWIQTLQSLVSLVSL